MNKTPLFPNTFKTTEWHYDYNRAMAFTLCLAPVTNAIFFSGIQLSNCIYTADRNEHVRLIMYCYIEPKRQCGTLCRLLD